ncbi:hypothetical protein DERF_000681 [Dermatophagoides farinae]|uniref:Uncharacterized protein n=1 Tax=Dermatophagoides farinae TaxID=6954 RepID=A0A922I926_DERFA|nr:hypothetical protein DERF_000681 [Dermatophagoides farinae]
MSKFNDLNSDKQILYLVQWFAEFSEFQRQDFLSDHLCPIYRNFFQQNLFTGSNHDDDNNDGAQEKTVKQNGSKLEKETNGETLIDNNDESSKLADNMNESLKISKKPPSIFECRMKLFKEWFLNQWQDQDRIEFLLRLKNVDSEFVMDFYRRLLSDENISNLTTFQSIIENDDNRKRLVERLDMMNMAIFTTKKSNVLEHSQQQQQQIDLTVNGFSSSESKPDLLANCHSAIPTTTRINE